jgi:hypothetical protein
MLFPIDQVKIKLFKVSDKSEIRVANKDVN